MAQTKYTDGSGVAEIWANTKNYVTAQLLSKSDVGHIHSYNDLTDKPTIPTVNEGTLTINVNGATAGTFSANQETDETVSINIEGAEYASKAEVIDTVLSEMNYLL